MDHPNELVSTLAFNVIVVRFDSAFRVFNEQVSTISPEPRDQAKNQTSWLLQPNQLRRARQER